MTLQTIKNNSIHILLYIALIFWASAFVGIRIGLKSYTPESLALFRYLIASIVLIPIFLRYCHGHKSLLISESSKIVLIGILGFAIYNIALNYGEITTSASIASFLIGQSPVIIILLAVIFLKERLNKLGWIGVAISIIGIFIILLSKLYSVHIEMGIIYILIALVTGSLYSILQKPLLKKISGLELAILAIWSGTLTMMIFLPQLCVEITKASSTATLSVIYLGIFPGAISYVIWSKVLEEIDVSHAAGHLYTMPIFTTIMGILIGEFPLLLSLLGGIIALLGAIIVHYSKKDNYIPRRIV
jgi:drug/metabolite transporter (DMT)-like permease